MLERVQTHTHTHYRKRPRLTIVIDHHNFVLGQRTCLHRSGIDVFYGVHTYKSFLSLSLVCLFVCICLFSFNGAGFRVFLWLLCVFLIAGGCGFITLLHRSAHYFLLQCVCVCVVCVLCVGVCVCVCVCVCVVHTYVRTLSLTLPLHSLCCTSL